MSSNKDPLDLLPLIIRRNVNGISFDESLTSEQLVEKVTELTHVRLDRERLSSVPLLDFIPLLTNLYLQCNSIENMSNFSALTQLRFLSLAENKITKVEGISSLTKLGLLDLTDNCIDHLDINELPKSLIILDLNGNLCVKEKSYVSEKIMAHLSNLKSLDGESVESVTSSDESDDDDVEEDTSLAENLQQKSFLNQDVSVDSRSDYLDKLSDNISHSLNEFSLAMNENEIGLQSDFTNFLSILETPALPPSDILSDREISVLEKDSKVAPDVTVSSKSSKKWSPRPPPAGATARVVRNTRNRPVSGKEKEKSTVKTNVRTPGARPFHRVVK